MNNTLSTFRSIADTCGVSQRQVEFAYRSRRIIATGKIGNALVFDQSATQKLLDAMIATGALSRAPVAPPVDTVPSAVEPLVPAEAAQPPPRRRGRPPKGGANAQ